MGKAVSWILRVELIWHCLELLLLIQVVRVHLRQLIKLVIGCLKLRSISKLLLMYLLKVLSLLVLRGLILLIKKDLLGKSLLLLLEQ